MLNKNNLTSHLKLVTGILTFALILTSVLAAFPNNVYAANNAQSACAYKHTVVAGETLSSIAIKYGTTYLEIAKANNLNEPYTIFVGQELCIPEGASNVPGGGTGDESAAAPAGPTFDVTFEENNSILLKVYSFPPKRSQIIKIGVWEPRWYNIEFEVVGRFRTDKGGNANVYQRLPKAYRDVPIEVCLKNPFTDKIVCDYFDPTIE